MKLLDISWLAIVVIVSAACANPGPPVEPVRANPDGVAIDGYSPVSYFTKGAPERGSPDFAASHGPVTYWLADASQQTLFEQTPERFVPAHGGWCTLMMGGSGRRTPGHPHSFAVVDDRLMLFWSGDTDESRGLGLKNWISKTGHDPDEERDYVARADARWRGFLEGRRRAEVILYKPSDAQAVTTGQLAEAEVAY